MPGSGVNTRLNLGFRHTWNLWFNINGISIRSLRPTWAESPRELGAKLSRSDYNQACEEKATFQKFLSNFVFKGSTVLLLPGGYPNTTYRDEYLGFVFHAITTSMPSTNSIKFAECVWEKVPRIWLQGYSLLCSWWISMCIISRYVKTLECTTEVLNATQLVRLATVRKSPLKRLLNQ